MVIVRKAFSMTLLALLLANMLTLAFNVQPIETSGTIRAQADGLIDPATALAKQEAGILSEAPPTKWTKTYGGTSDEEAQALVQTGDGGYALAGYTCSFGAGNSDVWLVKTDSAGNILWSKTYGGTGWDDACALVKTTDGGYALAGWTGPFGAGNYDFWLVKADSAGNAQWNKTYGGANDDRAWALKQTGDGGYALAGYTYSFGAGSGDVWLVKTDAAGNMQWSKTYGGSGGGEAHDLVQTTHGGYAIAGVTSSGAGSGDVWLVKTDAAGNMQWSKTYGGTNYDGAWALVQTTDGGYALAGYTCSFGAGNSDVWLVKTAPVYTVTFSELGLAQGTQWSVTFNGETSGSTSNMITFSAANGVYSFSITPPTGYSVSPSSGSVTVNDASRAEYILFSLPPGYSPQNLVATPLNSKVDLKWDPPQQSGVQNYYVFRGSSADFTVWGSQRATLDANTREFQDQVSDNAIYYYKVIAVYPQGWSPPSQTACARLESVKGIESTITGVTSLSVPLLHFYSLQQNFYLFTGNEDAQGNPIVYWCQNCVNFMQNWNPFGSCFAIMYIFSYDWNSGEISQFPQHGSPPIPLPMISVPDTLYFKAEITGGSLLMINSIGLWLWSNLHLTSDAFISTVSNPYGSPHSIDRPNFDVVGGGIPPGDVTFNSGNGYVSCETEIGGKWIPALNERLVADNNMDGPRETSTGLQWNDLINRAYYYYQDSARDYKGVMFVPNFNAPSTQATLFNTLGKIVRNLVFSAACPVYLDLRDDQGRCVGYNQTSGAVDFQIDNVVWGSNQTLLVFDPSGTYHVSVTGTENGTFTLGTSWQDTSGATYVVSNLTNTITENETQVYDIGANANVTLTNITSKTVIGQGFILQVNATVADLGGPNATFDVALYTNGTLRGTQSALNVSGWNSETVCFAWNTTGVSYGNYTLSANLQPINSNFTGGWVVISGVGDINGDFKVDIQDLSRVSAAYGSLQINDPDDPKYGQYWHPVTCPTCPHTPNADITSDGKVDIADLARTSGNFGWYQP